MNRRIGAAVCAAVGLGGLLVAVVPQHALTIGRLAAATVVVTAGVLVLGAVGPFVARDVPVTGLDVVATPGAAPLDPHGLRDARRDLDRPSISGSVPTPVRERLVTAARLRLHGIGVDIDDERSRARAAGLLRAETWRLVTGEPETARPGAVGSPRLGRTSAAALVHRVLDELDRLDEPNPDIPARDIPTRDIPTRDIPTHDTPATAAGTGARHGNR